MPSVLDKYWQIIHKRVFAYIMDVIIIVVFDNKDNGTIIALTVSGIELF